MPRRGWLLAAATVALLALLPLADGLLLDGLGIVGYTVCHQLPDRSLSVDGRPLPLCARCTGIYLGFVVGLLGLALLGKPRASRLPPGGVTLLLLLSFVAMALDGLNSLLQLFPETLQAYPPSNLLRLITGMAAGTALALLLVPLFNDALWAGRDPSESVADLGELLGYVVLVGMGVVVAHSDVPALLYPVALLSTLGVLLALSMAGATLAATLARRERRARSLREALPVLAGGFLLATAAMALMGAARLYLSLPLGI